MWKALEIAYEGTSQIKENRINTPTTEFDLLRMKTGETIAEFQLRYTHLTNQPHRLAKRLDEVNTSKSKSIALNTIKEDQNEDDLDDEEIGMPVRRFENSIERIKVPKQVSKGTQEIDERSKIKIKSFAMNVRNPVITNQNVLNRKKMKRTKRRNSVNSKESLRLRHMGRWFL
ncbi:hypothetical protein K1719_043209 [Acacia pycnantha]|nr:hypothetical protein K1719_043209 [Acacia pycnantha]